MYILTCSVIRNIIMRQLITFNLNDNKINYCNYNHGKNIIIPSMET